MQSAINYEIARPRTEDAPHAAPASRRRRAATLTAGIRSVVRGT